MDGIKLNTQRLRSTLYDDENESSKDSNKANVKKSWTRFIPNVKVLIALILILQCVQIYFFVNPINLAQQLDAVKVINDVSKKVSVPPTEIPIVGVIGDGKVLPDIDTLKKANDVNAQVYANAQNGDYVLGYSSKMVIYRKNDDKVVYEGLSPNALVTNTQNGLVSDLTSAVKQAGLIASDSSQTPSVSVVTDVTVLKNQNREFYKDAEKDDLIGVFPDSNLIVIYRPSSKRIVNSGKVQTTITK